MQILNISVTTILINLIIRIFFSYNPYQHYSGPEIVPNNFDPLNNEYESTYNDIPENEYNKASNLMFNIKKESVEKEFKQHPKKTK